MNLLGKNHNCFYTLKGERNMEKVIVNGQWVDRQAAVVDVEDRGYQFGDGIYEVIRVYNGKLFQTAPHLQRLVESAKKIGIDLPFQLDDLLQKMNQLVKENNLELGIVYLQVTRGVSLRQHAFPKEKVKPSLVMYTRSYPRPEKEMEQGVKAHLVDDIRWLRCDIKSLNLLGSVLAKQQASERGCMEAIMHRDNVVTEGSSSNVFIVKEGTIITHPATNLILNGITRQTVLQICEAKQWAVEERAFTTEELLTADEVFITSTTSEVMPVIAIDEHPIGEGTPGSITQMLQAIIDEEIQRECK
jgi:D-alanine transaminase